MEPHAAWTSGEGRENPGVADRALDDPSLIKDLIWGLTDPDPRTRLGSADALARVAAAHPEWIQGHKRALLALARQARVREIRCRLTRALSHLRLTRPERDEAAAVMGRDPTVVAPIVRTFARLEPCEGADLAERRLGPISQAVGGVVHGGELTQYCRTCVLRDGLAPPVEPR